MDLAYIIPLTELYGGTAKFFGMENRVSVEIPEGQWVDLGRPGLVTVKIQAGIA